MPGLLYRLCLHLAGTGQIPSIPVGRRCRIDVRWVDQWLAGGGYRAPGDESPGRCSRGTLADSLTIHLLRFASPHMQRSVKRADRQQHLEAAARAAFELRAGRNLTELNGRPRVPGYWNSREYCVPGNETQSALHEVRLK